MSEAHIFDRMDEGELTDFCVLAEGLPSAALARARLEALRDSVVADREARDAAKREATIAAILAETPEGNDAWQQLMSALAGEDIDARDAAVAMIERLAERHAGFAICTLGGMYEDGRYGKPVDGEKAMATYLAGARGGDFECMYRVGSLYQRGVGAEPDIFQAMHWYEQAKDRNIFAFDALLRLWHKGYGGPAAKTLLAEGHKRMIGWYDHMMSPDTPVADKPKLVIEVWLMICGYQKDFENWRGA